jgi:hypothetical protein
MKELFLNELSIFPLAGNFNEAYVRIYRFVQAYKKRPEDIFGKRICSEEYLGNIMISQDLSLQQFCQDSRGRTLGSLLLGLTKHPYIESDSSQEEEYIESNYYIVKNAENFPTYGLAAAHLHESIGISFASESFWDTLEYTLLIKKKEHDAFDTVLAVSSPEHFNAETFSNWRENHTPLKLIKSEVPFHKKKISLREDHGKDILNAFAQRIVRSPYIIEIVNSLPFNPHLNNFIKSFDRSGLVEIVLIDTDAGYGLVVKTTGRNLRETKEIAGILREEFG